MALQALGGQGGSWQTAIGGPAGGPYGGHLESIHIIIRTYLKNNPAKFHTDPI